MLSEKLNRALIISAVLAIPISEIAFTLFLADVLGSLNTFLLFVVTTILGLVAISYQSTRIIGPMGDKLRKMNRKTKAYKTLNDRHGLRIGIVIVSSILMILPGFVTDTVAYLLLIPFGSDSMLDKVSAKLAASVSKNEGQSRKKRRKPSKQRAPRNPSLPPRRVS